MMENDRNRYASASDWMSKLKADELWHRQLQKLQNSTAGDLKGYHDEAARRIGNGEIFEFWEIYHDAELVVTEIWDTTAPDSLVKLKIYAIGMLSMEWLEHHEDTHQAGIGSSRLTGELASAQAMIYWKRLQEAQFVDADCQLLPTTTRKQAMYIAEVFAETLTIASKWKTFEQLWGIANLAQEKWNLQQTGTLPSRSKEIDRIFSD